MRRIVMFNRVSADGYFATEDGGLDWTVPEPEMDRQAVRAMPEVDAFLLGRRTYEMFASYWPHALDGGHGEALSPEHRAMAVSLNESTKIVFSRTLDEPAWRHTRVVRELDRASIEALKREPGRDMMILGSGSIATQLTALDLVDEHHLLVAPVLLGSGRRLFGDLARPARLALRSAQPFPHGNVLLRYGRAEG